MNKQQIEEYCNSAAFLKSKKISDDNYARLVAMAAPVISATDTLWFRLGFSPEAMEIQCGDPETAFQCEYGEYVIRMDFSSEIGNSSMWWRKGYEKEALQELDCFAHGTPLRPATAGEIDQFQWAFHAAIRHFIRATQNI